MSVHQLGRVCRWRLSGIWMVNLYECQISKFAQFCSLILCFVWIRYARCTRSVSIGEHLYFMTPCSSSLVFQKLEMTIVDVFTCWMFVQFHLPTMHIWQLFVQGSTWSQSPQTVDHWPVEWVQLAEAWALQVLPLELTMFQQGDQCGHFPHWRKMSKRLCSIVEVHLKKLSDHTHPWQVVGEGEIKRMSKFDWDTIRFSSFQSFPGICFVLISDTEPNSQPDSLRYKSWVSYIFLMQLILLSLVSFYRILLPFCNCGLHLLLLDWSWSCVSMTGRSSPHFFSWSSTRYQTWPCCPITISVNKHDLTSILYWTKTYDCCFYFSIILPMSIDGHSISLIAPWLHCNRFVNNSALFMSV